MNSDARLHKQGNRGVHCRRHDDEMLSLKLQDEKKQDERREFLKSQCYPVNV